MATVNFLVKGTTNPSKIYLRFVNNGSINITTITELVVNPNFWDPKNQRIRNGLEVRNRGEINLTLTKIKIKIISVFNCEYLNGGVINKIGLIKRYNLSLIDHKAKFLLKLMRQNST